MSRQPTPPRVARWLVRVCLRRPEREVIMGDLDELFARRVSRGERHVRLRYWWDALGSIAARWKRPRAQSRPSRYRQRRTAPHWDALLQDLRVAARRMYSDRRLTSVVVATLALGIGANTAVFSVVHEAMLRPQAGVAHPNRLGFVELVYRENPDRRSGISGRELAELNTGVRTLDGMATFSALGLHAVPPGGEPSAIMGQAILGDYFRLLGIRPAVGRLLNGEETLPGADPGVSVISERLWKSMFAGDSAVVGRSLHANGQALTIVGVAGGGFRGVLRGYDVDVWVSSAAMEPLRRRPSGWGSTPPLDRVQYSVAVARVRDGVSFAAAESDLRAAYARLAVTHPEAGERLRTTQPNFFPGIGLEPPFRARTAAAARMLLVVVGLVLLIACANVTNLLLFRGVRRTREVALRRALGASGPRMARQLAVESALLAATGGVVGLAVAFGLARLLQGTTVVGVRDFHGMALEAPVLVFALVATLLTVLLFGPLPALFAGRLEPSAAFRASAGGAAGGGRHLRSGLAAFQVAISLALLVGALLLTRTVAKLHAVELGFDPSRVYTLMLDFYPQGFTPQQTRELSERLITELRALPEVESAGGGTTAPFWGLSGGVRLQHPNGRDSLVVMSESVTPGYFETLGIEMQGGRPFREADMQQTGARNVVISRALARRLFGDVDPVGRVVRSAQLSLNLDPTGRLSSAAMGSESGFTIVGVTADIRTISPTQEPDEILYRPARFDMPRFMIVLRAGRDRKAFSETAADAIHKTMARLAPEMPVLSLVSLDDALESRIGQRRVLARLLGLLSSLTVVLAGVGLYGVIGYSVAARTREMGIRVALGARSAAVAGLVLRHALTIVGIGLVVGTLGAFAVARLVKSNLFGVTPVDPLTYVGAAVFFIVVALLATLPPLRTATRVDPMDVLREE